MKLSRLLAYAAAGIIGGLLIENSALILKQRAGDKMHDVKNSARKTKRKFKKALAHSN